MALYNQKLQQLQQQSGKTTPRADDPLEEKGLLGLIPRVSQRLCAVNRDGPRTPFTEEGRLLLLQDACRENDIDCLTLHQAFCMQELQKNALPLVTSNADGIKGLQTLQGLMNPNPGLSREALDWFVNFPGLLGPMLRCSARYRDSMGDVQSHIIQLGKHWEYFLHLHLSSRTPPLAMFTKDKLGIKSLALQKVIFKCIHRRLWGNSSPELDQCSIVAEHLFDEETRRTRDLDQRLHGHDDEIAKAMGVMRQQLTHTYQSIFLNHQKHVQNAVQAVANPAVRPPGSAPSLGSRNQPPAGQLQSLSSAFQGTQARPSRGASSSSVNPLSSRPRGQPRGSIHNQPTLHSNVPTLRSNVLSNQAQREGQQSYYIHQVPDGSLANSTPVNHSHSFNPSDYQQARDILQRSLPSPQGIGLPRMPLFPKAGQLRPPITQPPEPHHSILQAHLRDADCVMDPSLPTGALLPLFSYFSDFFLKPIFITPNKLNITEKLDLTNDVFKSLPKDVPDPLGGPAKRHIRPGTRLIRLRCIRTTSIHLTGSEWAVTETHWPPSLAMILNEKPLEVRRKGEHTTDLPVDETADLEPGVNNLRASFLKKPNATGPNERYALAVEILTLADADAIRAQVRHLPAAETPKRIRALLKSKDADIEILSTDLTISVRDPWTAQLLQVPVRGAQCRHFECFDLNVFLETRRPEPWKPEQFACPICGSDARPASLTRDAWFMSVVSELRRTGKEDITSILVDEKANWKAKAEEIEGESGDGTGAMRTERESGRPSTGRTLSAPTEADVIVLE